MNRSTVVLLMLACGCGGGSNPSGSAASGGAGGAGTTSSTETTAAPVAVSTASSSGSAGGAYEDPYGCLDGEPPHRPASIPDGWRPWACWSQKPECMAWIPDDPATMVAPVEWEACSPGSPVVDGCRQMTRPWWPGENAVIGETFPAIPSLDALSPGTLLRLARVAIRGTGSDDSYIEYGVYDADGKARSAFRRAVGGTIGCGYQDYDLNEGVWVVSPLGDNTSSTSESPLDGAMVFDVASRDVSLPYRDENPGQSGWWAGQSWILEFTGPDLILHDRGFSSTVSAHTTANDPVGARPTTALAVVGDEVIWEVFTSTQLGIRAYDPILGTHDLVRYLDDPSRGAGTPGTDGIDLVWTEGTERGDGDFTYPSRDIMTSPYTTDPEALEPRRLRSDPSDYFGIEGAAFRVGCGRAAKYGPTRTDVQVVRLSDGHAWRLNAVDDVWAAGPIVGLTCDELFVVVYTWKDGVFQNATIQAIRFDAMGEGIEPD